MVFTSAAPHVVYFAQSISDPGGNGNGYLDAGETVDLEITVRNYGEPASGVTAVLSSIDSYITILQASASHGDMATGATAVNSAEPFVVVASADTPLGHLAQFTITATYADGDATSNFAIPVGKYHYVVWDPTADTSSGPDIHATLAGLGFSGVYMEQLPVDDLDRYQTVWVSLGIYSSNYVIGLNSQEALAIVDYLNGGGCVYLEGGDCWNYDPTIGGHNFNSTFGLTSPQDGSNDCGPAQGKAGTFTEGMYFAYNGENNWIDHLSPANGSATLVLENGSPVYGLAVAYDQGTYKTVGASFEFTGLRNGTVPSTRAHFALTIMDFFLPIPSGVDDDVVVNKAARLAARPNPFNPNTTLQFMNPGDGRVHLGIYDVSGRLVRVLVDDEMSAGEGACIWNGMDESGRSVASGVYFARLKGADFSSSSKLVLLK